MYEKKNEFKTEKCTQSQQAMTAQNAALKAVFYPPRTFGA